MPEAWDSPLGDGWTAEPPIMEPVLPLTWDELRAPIRQPGLGIDRFALVVDLSTAVSNSSRWRLVVPEVQVSRDQGYVWKWLYSPAVSG
jgi:hypothetical protein